MPRYEIRLGVIGMAPANMASTLTLPCIMSLLALAAAAPACVTESLMSFGPSAQPAKKTPCVAASTGLDVLSHALESYTALPFDQRPKPARPL